MKRKNSLGVYSGIALGLVSIYALTIYFDVTPAALKGFMVSTALLLAGMIALAAILVVIIKIVGRIIHRHDEPFDNQDDDHE